jgi:histidinol dehydrogenase
MIPILHDGTAAFDAWIRKLVSRGADDLDAVAPAVRAIVDDVRRGGDEAVRQFVERFERRTPQALVTKDFDGAAALARIDPELRASLEQASARIRAYHERQRSEGFRYEEDGIVLGMRVRPVERAGVYAPGGKARYPSSVLMTAIPARVAGVKHVVLASPSPDDTVLAAAHLAGVTEHLDAGGAHAIAALAYGTESLPRVDKIVGPGNIYVACAKKLVFGDVDIDGIAGPSEVLVLADSGADPELIASDLLSQAEHDEAAYPLLVTTSASVAERSAAALDRQLASLPRFAIASASVRDRSAAFVVEDEARMLALANAIAAEHVAIHAERADALLDGLHAAGAIFLGGYTPVALGDYFAGPSHVLPTGGAVRFGSPLGVYDFVNRSSVVRYSRDALARHAPQVTRFARAEGLEGHARSIELRLGATPLDSNRSDPGRSKA